MIRRFFLRFRVSMTVAGAFLFLFLVLSMILFPFREVEQLRTGYFIVHLNKKNTPPDYEFVSKKPQKWVKLGGISSMAYRAIIVSEDSAFYSHFGVDWFQLQNAIEDWLFKNKKLRGASTITQQLAKNLFLTRDKSFLRKLIEIPLAVYIDWRLPKNKILEAYLNAIEYGDQIYGIADASRIYFGKTPSSLTLREGAFLAMLLPNPKKYSRSYRQGELTQYANKIILRIMKRMVSTGNISKEQFETQMGQRYLWEKSDDDEIDIPDDEEEVSN